MFPEKAPQKSERPLRARIFIGPYGLRAGWRFAAFFAIWLAIALAGTVVLKKPLLRAVHREWFGSILQPGLGALYALAAMWIMSRVESRPLSRFGLGGADRLRNFLTGAVAGFAALSILMGALVLTGAYRLGPPTLHSGEILYWGPLMAVALLCTGIFEELFSRGYALFALAQGIGFWPAATLLSIEFAAGHLRNRGEDMIGLCNAMLAGLVLSYTLRWSGSLWWAIGCHMTWDWAESFFYGVADSGGIAPHHFLSGQPAGAAWLSGGSAGPEGSVLAIPAFLLLIAMVRVTALRQTVPGLDRLRKPTTPPLGRQAQLAQISRVSE